LKDCEQRSLVCALRDKVCKGDEDLAYHLWIAASLGHGVKHLKALTCKLHLDDGDIAILLNIVVSLGVNSIGDVVPLRGSFLMVLLIFSDKSLSSAELDGFPEQAHDMHGNIVLLEPSGLEVELPEPYIKQNAPTSPAVVQQLMRDGCCVEMAVVWLLFSGVVDCLLPNWGTIGMPW